MADGYTMVLPFNPAVTIDGSRFRSTIKCGAGVVGVTGAQVCSWGFGRPRRPRVAVELEQEGAGAGVLTTDACRSWSSRQTSRLRSSSRCSPIFWIFLRVRWGCEGALRCPAHDGSAFKGVVVVTEHGTSPYDFASRYFAPWNGINEVRRGTLCRV